MKWQYEKYLGCRNLQEQVSKFVLIFHCTKKNVLLLFSSYSRSEQFSNKISFPSFPFWCLFIWISEENFKFSMGSNYSYLSGRLFSPIILRLGIGVHNAMKGDGLQSISGYRARMIEECGTICNKVYKVIKIQATYFCK